MLTLINITVDYDLMKIFSEYYRHIHNNVQKNWTLILSNTLIEPYFIEGSLTSTKEDMLRNQIRQYKQ